MQPKKGYLEAPVKLASVASEAPLTIIMNKRARHLTLDAEERRELGRFARHLTTPQGLAIRARIVLGADAGMSNLQLARELHTTVPTVLKWQRRWEVHGLAGIIEGWPNHNWRRKPVQPASATEKQLARAKKTVNESQLSPVSRPLRAGLSSTTVGRIWSTYGVRPEDTTGVRSNAGPRFARGLKDLVGLYISPLQSTLLVSADRRQGADSSEVSEPDFSRNAEACSDRVNTFMAALSLMWDEVISCSILQEGSQEFLNFLEQAETTVAGGLDIHSVTDNYQILRSSEVRGWIDAHPRHHLHFTSFGGSWLAQVKSWLDEMSRFCLQDDAFQNAPSVVNAMLTYTSPRNSTAGPFKWIASVALAKE